MSSLMLQFLPYRQSFCPEEQSTLIANPLPICLPQAAFPVPASQATNPVSQCPYYITERLHWQQVGHRQPIASRQR